MDDPIKVIHKYKNNNKRIQYHVNIFIGDILEEKYLKILNKIKDLNFYDTLISLNEKEYKILETKYGEYWYEKFFISYHLINSILNIIETPNKLKELKNIYQTEWINNHIVNYRKRINVLSSSYGLSVKQTRERKMIKKIIKMQQNEDIENVDYMITKTQMNESRVSNIYGSQDKPFKIVDAKDQNWCDEKSTSENQEGGENEIRDAEFVDTIEEPKKLESFDDIVEEDLMNADLYFSNLDEIDQNLNVTTKQIKNIIGNNVYEKASQIIDFDTKNDNNMFDENLKNVFRKFYITTQYIFKDDTIKTINNKICCGFKNNSKFGDNIYIIPSYQYLWSEYRLGNSIDKIMIGKKWILKNDLLKIDIIPNPNLSIYEELRNNLKILRNNIKRQGKIKYEDDEHNILYDYEGFYSMNELFMVDIYNELGIDYQPNFEELKNMIDVYFKIYFPNITPDDITNILQFLKDPKTKSESIKLKNVYETLNNYLISENESMKDIEITKIKNRKNYEKYFKGNYVTQSAIRTYIFENYEKIDLFRIFDNFILTEDYPFIQYQPIDGIARSRYNEKYLLKQENKDIIKKWFENAPYGISFKVKINEIVKDRYMSINLNENGRLDYRIQWREENMLTVQDITSTYIYINNLINKINQENAKYHIKLNNIKNDAFKFTFISTIQRFVLPENFSINHNDLSDFARYFYPYISVVIEPRKRQSKIKKENEEKSKFGTYLRYKRVSKYDNKSKIEHRIIFFMKNYEYNDQSLAEEISKEFNITLEQANTEIEIVRSKYPNIKKSRKVLKKLENIPKYKPAGIDINIQGKNRSNYKMRISGARDNNQLDRIILFMNILIYLYTEAYLYKNPEKQIMRDRLKKLSKIAKRNGKVNDILELTTNSKNIKQMIAVDKKRLNYKASEDQNQWTRNCQNSGKDKQRRPQYYLNATDLMNQGYVWKDKLDDYDYGHYEKKINIQKGKKKIDTVLQAIKLPLDDTGENFIYYTCDPDINGDHMYVGFLSKSKNPYGEAMPCCFIKNHLYSKNNEKRNYYLKNIGLLNDVETENKILGDQLYILQDSNKIQEGRFAFLPKYLDIFMNIINGNTKIIKNNYLVQSNTGYFFKYGVSLMDEIQDEYRYLTSICVALDLTLGKIKELLISALKKDTKNLIFTSLNNGDVKTQFGSIDNYISYIENNTFLDYKNLNDLLCTPGIVSKNGLNIIIFNKKVRIIKKKLEKEKIQENYFIACQNFENINEMKSTIRENIFLVKENKIYYPIIMVKKENELSKEVNILKTFSYKNQNILLDKIFDYYKINCQSEYSLLINDNSSKSINAKTIMEILNSLHDKKYKIKYQYVDIRNKCRYIITAAGYIIPTLPSGSIYNISIVSSIDKYITDYDTTFDYLSDIYKLTKAQIKCKPIGFLYRSKTEKSYNAIGIVIQTDESIPVTEKKLTNDYVSKTKLIAQNNLNDANIDLQIHKGPKNYIIDQRMNSVAYNSYETELYQLFRLHLSYYLNNVAYGLKAKEELESILTSSDRQEKRNKIKALLYKISNKDLYTVFLQLINRIQKGTSSNVEYNDKDNTYQNITSDEIIYENDDNGKIKRSPYDPNTVSETSSFTSPVSPHAPINFSYQFNSSTPPIIKGKLPVEEKDWIDVIPNNTEIDYTHYKVKNIRDLCYNNSKNSCNNDYCSWNNSKNLCMLKIKKDTFINFVNKVTEELFQNELKANEILRKGKYFVSDIVNYNVFTERPDERIITSSNNNIEKILSEIFGKDNIPKIGKRSNSVEPLQNYEQINADHPLKDINTWYIQDIIDNNNTIYRAFANAYYWLTHPFNTNIYRNLGYYSSMQTNLSNVYKSQVIDWLLKNTNQVELNNLAKYTKMKLRDFAEKISNWIQTKTNCLIELYILSQKYESFIEIYDNNYNVIYQIHPDHGIIYDYKYDTKKNDKYKNMKNILYFKFYYESNNDIPNKIEVMYKKS